MDPIERLRFLAPGTGAREGGEKTQPFNRFPSHRVTVLPLGNVVYDLSKMTHSPTYSVKRGHVCHLHERERDLERDTRDRERERSAEKKQVSHFSRPLSRNSSTNDIFISSRCHRLRELAPSGQGANSIG